ncbi:MAG: tetratricopeptide repeat protein [Candidatus Hodarchaeales archaeon]|jgi:tetratricopeptide (TPR) repeat protein
MMSDPRPEELIHAEELIYDGKVEEAYEIISNFEKTSELSSKDQLWLLLLKGLGYAINQQYKESVEIGEQAYKLSSDLNMKSEKIESLFLRAHMASIGKPNEALDSILEAEKLYNSLSEKSSAIISKIEFHLMYYKTMIYISKSDINNALGIALQTLVMAEKIKENVVVGTLLFLIGLIYFQKGELDTALEYVMRSSEITKKLDFQVGTGANLWLIGVIYLFKGNFNRALENCKKSLSIAKISDYYKAQSLSVLGSIYREKGELNKALKYIKQSTKLAQATLNYFYIIANNRSTAEIYMRQGNLEKAINYNEQSLGLIQKVGQTFLMTPTLLYLVVINLDHNSPERAEKYLKKFEIFSEKDESALFRHGFPLAKAFMLKASSRIRDKVQAEGLLRQIVEDDIAYPQFHILAIISLCDLLLEELSIYNDPVVINEINPLVTQLLNISKNQHSFLWLAETKLLQAKLALIQMEIEEAKRLLTEAQRIADLHGLNLLAQKISYEHDILLEKTQEWENLKEKNAPIAERIELASFDAVINRLQGKSAVDPPELVEEEPIQLLIMDNSGVPYFNYSFVKDWDTEGLFSAFMSAFNTFSSELFSKSIDRIRIGDNVILINPIESFLACYVIKGQSYPALQKLTRFTEAIKENSEIWQALNKSVKTSEMLELDKPPALKTVINDIFV